MRERRRLPREANRPVLLISDQNLTAAAPYACATPTYVRSMSANIELGSVADVTAAAAALAGLALSARSLKVAQSANDTAERTRTETIDAARTAASREDDRDRRALASHLQAWWAYTEDPSISTNGAKVYGVVVSNRGSTSAVFHDVRIATVGNNHPSGEDIEIVTVPPGLYFVASNAVTGGSAWGRPVLVTDESAFFPLTFARKYDVRTIRFRDQLGTPWQWRPTDGLVEVAPEAGRETAATP